MDPDFLGQNVTFYSLKLQVYCMKQLSLKLTCIINIQIYCALFKVAKVKLGF